MLAVIVSTELGIMQKRSQQWLFLAAVQSFHLMVPRTGFAHDHECSVLCLDFMGLLVSWGMAVRGALESFTSVEAELSHPASTEP